MNDTAKGAERQAGGPEPRDTPMVPADVPDAADLIEIHDPAVGVTILVSVPPPPRLARQDRPADATAPVERPDEPRAR